MTEAVARRYRDLDLWPLEEVLEALWEAQLRALSALKPALPHLQVAVQEAAERLEVGGRLAYAGAGTSARLAAMDAAELPPTFGWPQDRLRVFVAGGKEALWESREGAEDDLEGGVALGETLEPGDVLVAVSASGRTPFALGVLQGAKAKGAWTIALANNPGAPLLQEACRPILLDTGPEVVAGSTRLGAGTAQKAALNLFSTALMVRLGRVYGNLMVEMELGNEKLFRRGVALLQAMGLSGDLEGALRRAGRVSLAALLLQGVPLEEARRRLHQGLRRALENA